MSNKELSNVFKSLSMLMALHDENPFKIKMYDSASQLIKNGGVDFINVDAAELENHDGIGKKIAADIVEIRETGSVSNLKELMDITPVGLIEVLNLKGIGPKKVRSLWKDLDVTSLEDVILECEKGTVSSLKGFGTKTQDKILGISHFNIDYRGKLLFAEAKSIADVILKQSSDLNIVGELARGCDIISRIQFLTDNSKDVFPILNSIDFLTYSTIDSSPYVWRGKDNQSNIMIEVIQSSNVKLDQFLLSCSSEHLGFTFEDKSLGELARTMSDFNEEKLYKTVNKVFPPIGSREGEWELDTTEERINNLITDADLKGVLHNHSTWSDGAKSIEEMALECKSLGYGYFGISDHSKSAFYANGLYEDRIIKQQVEIDEINSKHTDFTIFKGIEADILTDGRLDYEDNVLASFDFVVASIHSILEMDVNKSMERLIKAIENPYTTFLGHVTGRLLLRRQGYPVNHHKIIDACAENKVIIELNSNPWRLDMDWRYIDYAMEKGVMMSINPDAHHLEGLKDMKFGVISGRKGGLTKEYCFNTKTSEEVALYFNKKKEVLNGKD